MPKKDELSIDHLKWLVAKRSENQKISLLLFGILKKHSSSIRKSTDYLNISQGLIAAIFSLWRAVFLSDSFSDMHRTLEDAEEFLGKLILDNSISYPQDRNTRDWTFIYYLNNARYRLESIARHHPEIFRTPEDRSRGPHKEAWEYYQETLLLAIRSFEKALKKL